MTVTGGLKGKRLAIIEDGYFLDDETERCLIGLGAVVSRFSVYQALAEMKSGFPYDGAIVDLTLDAPVLLEVSERLEELDIPHLFAIAEPPPPAMRGSAFHLCTDDVEISRIYNGLFGDHRLH